MEVTLKKCKITKSIFNQTLEVNFKIISKYKSLGWVFIENNKWILLYYPFNHELKKIMLFSDVSIEPTEYPEKFKIKIVFSNGESSTSPSLTKEEADKIKDDLLELKHITNTNGQFFI